MPKTQPAKKRASKKRATSKKTDVPEWKSLLEEAKSKKDTEVAALAAMCSIFDNWTQEQRNRNLEYIAGKYYDFS